MKYLFFCLYDKRCGYEHEPRNKLAVKRRCIVISEKKEEEDEANVKPTWDLIKFICLMICFDALWRRWTLSSRHPPSLGASIGKWYFGFLSTYLRLSSQPCRILTECSRPFRLYFINRSLISRWLLFTLVFSSSNFFSFVLLPIKNDAIWVLMLFRSSCLRKREV